SPFSTLLKEKMPPRGATSFHEILGAVIAKQIVSRQDLGGCLRATLLILLEGSPTVNDWGGALRSIISGDIDVDRIDYVMRDGMRAATEYGRLDLHRLMSHFEIIRDHDDNFIIGPGLRARPAV